MAHATALTDYNFSGVRMRCLLTGRETNGLFCLLENESSGESGTPTHVHMLEDETLYVHEGRIEALIDGVTRIVCQGEALFMPRGVPHRLRNTSASRSRYSILCTPSGFEDFVAQAGCILEPGEIPKALSREDIERMKRLAPTFGITILPSVP